uniref:Predicted protein n=1 Tax=Hordeum vulgare subsp. vulgare TaxID=112509 RepID=F2CZ98_HORVV|nr:predicted protein [Hordeum vulgare subsp. vulgare]
MNWCMCGHAGAASTLGGLKETTRCDGEWMQFYASFLVLGVQQKL